MRTSKQNSSRTGDVAMRETARRTARTRWAVPAATALAVVGTALAVPAAGQAAGMELDPDNIWMKALDANGNPVTQAAAHPDRLEIKFQVAYTGTGATVDPSGSARNIEVTLPEGIQGNPQAVPKCPMSSFNRERCSPATIVGSHNLFYKASRGTGNEPSTLYNLDPPEGVVARFGMKVLPVPVVMDMTVKSDGSYAIVTKISNASQALLLLGSTTTIYGVPNARNGSNGPNVPLLTLGSECGTVPEGKIRANSWQNSDTWLEANPTMPALTGCDRLQFQPKLDLRPTSDVADAPSGYRVRLDVPQNQTPTSTGTPPLKRAEILFPEGTAISPGGANGLGSCTDEQARIGVDATPLCPSAARIGSVRIDTPVIDVPMEGGVFVATPKSQDSRSGEMFRIFLLASAKGVDIKQEGKLYPDPVTGRLKAVFDNAAKQPFETLTVDLDGGPGAALVNPATCGTHTTSATFTSWGGQTTTDESSFTIACAPVLGSFSPVVNAGSSSLLAGAVAPFNLSIAKPDGQSVLSGLGLALPKGLLANLKGNLGQVVGSVRTLAGSGAAPFALNGTVTLEGPYGDAPFSLKVVVPAKAGPYNLGEVVVKQKLYVDPDTAQVTVVSDPIPTILQGVPTRIQRLDVSVDKPGFMINPTTCEAQSIGGSLSAITGQTAAVNVRFQVGGCGDLEYAPKLALEVSGELKNGGHPQLDATLTTTKGHANQKTAQVTLPLNLALDPQNAKALCEPAQAASNSCPAESIVGNASAVSILDVPLEGPVYFVRGERTTAQGRVVATLPKLFIPLSGQGVTINVRASSDVVGKKLQTTFDDLPDAPIEAFALKLNGGANGILKVTNGDVCKSTSTPKVGQRFVGQNGRVARSNSTLSTGCTFGVVKTARKGNRISVTAGGLNKGKLSVSGKGVSKGSRTVGTGTTVASVAVSLNAASKRALAQGRTLRIKVKTSFKASGKKTVSKTKTVVVKPAKKR